MALRVEATLFGPDTQQYAGRGHAADDEQLATLQLAIDGLSRQAYRTLTGQEPPEAPLCFSSADTISGKFVELYFRAMLGRTE